MTQRIRYKGIDYVKIPRNHWDMLGGHSNPKLLKLRDKVNPTSTRGHKKYVYFEEKYSDGQPNSVPVYECVPH